MIASASSTSSTLQISASKEALVESELQLVDPSTVMAVEKYGENNPPNLADQQMQLSVPLTRTWKRLGSKSGRLQREPSIPIVIDHISGFKRPSSDVMDRKWVYAPRTSLEYENGVNEFLEFASTHDPDSNGKFLCPCVNFLNERRLSADQIREHVVCDGFNKGYTKWI
ncbi:Unknown protein [Striga hermonthica]|uniref:Transposase-associated domain-containing protein n=1 Tax=Striga hermonthica TaxID=68872 RepID=A0A9N7MJP0_STRHE|nr:Unknown protein [Striga hermonthica]